MVVASLESSGWWRGTGADVLACRSTVGYADGSVCSNNVAFEQMSLVPCGDEEHWLSANRAGGVVADIGRGNIDSELISLRRENARLQLELREAEKTRRRAALKAEQENEDLRQEVSSLHSLIADMLRLQPSLQPLAARAAPTLPETVLRGAATGLEQDIEADADRIDNETVMLAAETKMLAACLAADKAGLEAENVRLVEESKRLSLELAHRKWLGAEKEMFMTELAASGRFTDVSAIATGDTTMLHATSLREAELANENRELLDEKCRLSDELARTERERRRLAFLESQCRADLEQLQTEWLQRTDQDSPLRLSSRLSEGRSDSGVECQDEPILAIETFSDLQVVDGLDGRDSAPPDVALSDGACVQTAEIGMEARRLRTILSRVRACANGVTSELEDVEALDDASFLSLERVVQELEAEWCAAETRWRAALGSCLEPVSTAQPNSSGAEPCDGGTADLPISDKHVGSTSAQEISSDPIAPKQPDPPPLPTNWQALWSEAHQSHYFWHIPSDLVTWKVPPRTPPPLVMPPPESDSPHSCDETSGAAVSPRKHGAEPWQEGAGVSLVANHKDADLLPSTQEADDEAKELHSHGGRSPAVCSEKHEGSSAAQHVAEDVIQKLEQHQVNLREEFLEAQQAYTCSIEEHRQQLREEITTVQERCCRITTEHQAMLMEQSLQLRGDAADVWSDYAQHCEERLQVEFAEMLQACSNVSEEHRQFVSQQRSQLNSETVLAYTDFAEECEQQLIQMADLYSEQVVDRQKQLCEEVRRLCDECTSHTQREQQPQHIEQVRQKRLPVWSNFAAQCEQQLCEAADDFSAHVADCQNQLREEVHRLQHECSRVAADQQQLQQFDMSAMGTQLGTSIVQQQQLLQYQVAASLEHARVEALQNEVRRLSAQVPLQQTSSYPSECIKSGEPSPACPLASRPAVSANSDTCCSSALPQIGVPPNARPSPLAFGARLDAARSRSNVLVSPISSPRLSSPRRELGSQHTSVQLGSPDMADVEMDAPTDREAYPVVVSPDAALVQEVRELLEERRRLMAQTAAARHASESDYSFYDGEDSAVPAASRDQEARQWVREASASPSPYRRLASSPFDGDSSSDSSPPSQAAAFQLRVSRGHRRERGKPRQLALIRASENEVAEKSAVAKAPANISTQRAFTAGALLQRSLSEHHYTRGRLRRSSTGTPMRGHTSLSPGPKSRRSSKDTTASQSGSRRSFQSIQAFSPCVIQDVTRRSHSTSPMSASLRKKSLMDPTRTPARLSASPFSPVDTTASPHMPSRSVVEGFFHIVSGQNAVPEADISWPETLRGSRLELAVVQDGFCPEPLTFSKPDPEGFGSEPFVFSLMETTLHDDGDLGGVLYGCVCGDDPASTPCSSVGQQSNPSMGVFCILSKIPIFSLLFKVLELLRRPSCLNYKTVNDVLQRLNARGLSEALCTHGVDVSELQSNVNCLRLELPLGRSPDCGWPHLAKYGQLRGNTLVRPPPEVTQTFAQWQAAWGLKRLLERWDNLVGGTLAKLLASVLLEQKVLLLGDVSRISTMALVLRALMWPFQWLHPYLSAPPPTSVLSKYPLLEAPFPWITSLTELPKEWDYRTQYEVPTDIVQGVLKHDYVYVSADFETSGGLKEKGLKLPGQRHKLFLKQVMQVKKKLREGKIDTTQAVDVVLGAASAAVQQLADLVRRFVYDAREKMENAAGGASLHDQCHEFEVFADWLAMDNPDVGGNDEMLCFYRTFFQTQLCLELLAEELDRPHVEVFHIVREGMCHLVASSDRNSCSVEMLENERLPSLQSRLAQELNMSCSEFDVIFPGGVCLSRSLTMSPAAQASEFFPGGR